MKSGCPNAGKKRGVDISGAQGQPATMYAEHTCQVIESVESFFFFSADRGTPCELTHHLTRRGGVIVAWIRAVHFGTCTRVFARG